MQKIRSAIKTKLNIQIFSAREFVLKIVEAIWTEHLKAADKIIVVNFIIFFPWNATTTKRGENFVKSNFVISYSQVKVVGCFKCAVFL